jgi:hypothetical protein
MSFSNPTHRIQRKRIAGMQGAWTKMWDPPRESPSTPELVAPTNPVPQFMQAQLGADVFRVTTPGVVQRQFCTA